MIRKSILYSTIFFSSFISCSKSVLNSNYYAERVNAFKKEPIVTGRIIFLGDSITEMGDWKWLTGDSTVINRGINGDNTTGILNRLDDIIVRQPSKLFILIGINDIANNISDIEIIDNYRQIIKRVKSESPGTILYLQSILPVNISANSFLHNYDKQSHIISTNLLLEQLATSDVFVNIYPLFLNVEQKMDLKYSIDGLHLNYDGYLKWVSFLKQQHFL